MRPVQSSAVSTLSSAMSLAQIAGSKWIESAPCVSQPGPGSMDVPGNHLAASQSVYQGLLHS